MGACRTCRAQIDLDGCHTCDAVRAVWASVRALDALAFLEWWFRPNPRRKATTKAELPQLVRAALDASDPCIVHEMQEQRGAHLTVLGTFLAVQLARIEQDGNSSRELYGARLDAYIQLTGRLGASRDDYLEDRGPGELLRVCERTAYVFRGPKQARTHPKAQPLQTKAFPVGLGGRHTDARVGRFWRPTVDPLAPDALDVHLKTVCSDCGEVFQTDTTQAKRCQACRDGRGTVLPTR
jgi:hypothetical protein